MQWYWQSTSWQVSSEFLNRKQPTAKSTAQVLRSTSSYIFVRAGKYLDFARTKPNLYRQPSISVPLHAMFGQLKPAGPSAVL